MRVDYERTLSSGIVGLVADDTVDARLEASASRKASSKLCMEVDLDGTTFVCKEKYQLLANLSNLHK